MSLTGRMCAIMATSLVVGTRGGTRPSHGIGRDYLPFAVTLILICFGLDSSRLAICSVRTPLR